MKKILLILLVCLSLSCNKEYIYWCEVTYWVGKPDDPNRFQKTESNISAFENTAFCDRSSWNDGNFTFFISCDCGREEVK